MTAKDVDALMGLCDRDHAYAATLGAAKVRALVRSYRKHHPGWTTNGVYDDRVYQLANRVMYLAQGIGRAAKRSRVR